MPPPTSRNQSRPGVPITGECERSRERFSPLREARGKEKDYVANTPRLLIVTGASRGIGAATARLAAARGYQVCVNYHRNREAAEEVVKASSKKGAKLSPSEPTLAMNPM